MLTAKQVAPKFGVHHQTIRLWAREGRIPSRRTPTGRYLFDEAEIDDMLASSYRPAVSPSAPAPAPASPS
jgi:excisionase family DNA binding protein